MGRIVSLLAVLLTFGCAIGAPKTQPMNEQAVIAQGKPIHLAALRSPAASYNGGYPFEGYFDKDPTASTTCKEFFDLLRNASHKPDTIEAALGILKQDKPKYFSHYVLLPNSLSLHESSYSNPRALVYGGTGEMVLTFNGNPRQRSYERLEVMCFNKSNATFEFREITFPKEASDDLENLSEQEKKQPFVISKINSSGNNDCRQCHQTPTRPNWDSYAIWPSSYGAVDDILFRENFLKEFGEGSDSFASRYTAAEKDALKTFVRNGRYSVLERNATDRPNLAAGKIFGILNAQRIVAELKRLGPAFLRVKEAFAEALYCPVKGIEHKEFMVYRGSDGQGTTMDVLTAPVDPDVKRISRLAGGYFKSKSSRLKSNFKIGEDNYFQSNDVGKAVANYYRSIGFSDEDSLYVPSTVVETNIRLANIEKLVKPLGIDIENWSLVINGGYEYEDGSGGERGSNFGQIMDKPFLETFYPNDNTLMELVAKRRAEGKPIDPTAEVLQEETAICDYLKTKR